MTSNSTAVQSQEQPQRQVHRQRYEALRAAGQGVTALALPPATLRSHSISASDVMHHEKIPGGWYYTIRLARGNALRLVNTSGTTSVALMAWCAADTSERLNLVDTMKVQWSISLRKGRVVYTDMGRVAFSIIEDTCGAHDALAGCTTAASNAMTFGAVVARNSRDNFLVAASKLGLSRRDVAGCVTFFSPVGVDARGKLVWKGDQTGSQRTPGDFVDLRAEMDMLVVLSNAGHPLDPTPSAIPAEVDVLHFVPPALSARDPCYLAGGEAARAFGFTKRHVEQGVRT